MYVLIGASGRADSVKTWCPQRHYIPQTISLLRVQIYERVCVYVFPNDCTPCLHILVEHTHLSQDTGTVTETHI